MVKGATWLSVTPEPERELPAAVATLELGHEPPSAAVGREQERVERLILHGPQRAWLAYLHHAVELIERRSGSEDVAVIRARTIARTVITNHHNLLLALPGPGWKLTAADRSALARIPSDPEPDNDDRDSPEPSLDPDEDPYDNPDDPANAHKGHS
jgi:hypothetical protein